MISQRPFLFRNALLFDGNGEAPRRGDLLLRGPVIEAVGEQLSLPEGGLLIPADDLCISPGWLDLHTHVFAGQGIFSIDPCEAGLANGVTTLVDAGSAGALTLPVFARYALYSARERIRAYVNVASSGIMHGHAAEPGFVADHCDRALHSVDLARRVLLEHPEMIIGWKARLTNVLAGHRYEDECHAWKVLRQLRDVTGLPFMVHHIESQIPPGALLDAMDRRDVYTHLYHGRAGSPFHPETGEPIEAALRARARGVLFDVGHGSGAFQWHTAEQACGRYGFWPDTISTDVHRYNLFWPVRDLATTMSKFLYLGATPAQVIAMVTGNAAAAIGNAVSLVAQAPATLTLFQIESGSYPLSDVNGALRHGSQRFLPLAVLQRGSPSPCYGLFAQGETPLARALQSLALL